MPRPPEAVSAHVREVARLETLAVASGRRAWRRVDPRYISESWTEQVRLLQPLIAAVQVSAATAGSSYGADALAEQGTWIAPEAFVNPRQFGGVSSDGRSLSGLLYSPATTTKSLIGGGMSVTDALRSGRGALDRILRTQVGDAARVGSGVDIATRPGGGYVRVLVGSSCPGCVILAGRFYRWNAGFDRHPKDDCVHVPTTESLSVNMVTDPYEHFRAMFESEQDAFWGKADAQAIRDGADIYQVGNARRGARKMMTTEGTSKRGAFGSSAEAARTGGRRLTPEAIYRLNGDNRAAALRDLERYGYILPGGQVPGGSTRGANYEGFGALGRGGARKAASQAVLNARATGVRDPSIRATMTEAERRLYDAEQRWIAVLDGRNPYVSPAFGNTPDLTGRLRGFGASSASGRGAPLTPEIAASVERDYRRWLNTRGEVFGN